MMHHNERPSYKIWGIINNIIFKGHDYSVDLWALGIFIYEMTQGESPFRDPKETIKKRYLNFPIDGAVFLAIALDQALESGKKNQ